MIVYQCDGQSASGHCEAVRFSSGWTYCAWLRGFPHVLSCQDIWMMLSVVLSRVVLMERHGNDNVLMMSWRINKYWDYFYLCYRIDWWDHIKLSRPYGKLLDGRPRWIIDSMFVNNDPHDILSILDIFQNYLKVIKGLQRGHSQVRFLHTA